MNRTLVHIVINNLIQKIAALIELIAQPLMCFDSTKRTIDYRGAAWRVYSVFNHFLKIILTDSCDQLFLIFEKLIFFKGAIWLVLEHIPRNFGTRETCKCIWDFWNPLFEYFLIRKLICTIDYINDGVGVFQEGLNLFIIQVFFVCGDLQQLLLDLLVTDVENGLIMIFMMFLCLIVHVLITVGIAHQKMLDKAGFTAAWRAYNSDLLLLFQFA